jgi:hypothetical protein
LDLLNLCLLKVMLRLGNGGTSRGPDVISEKRCSFSRQTMQPFTKLEVFSHVHEDELQHRPWEAQSLHLDTTEPLWSVLETRMRKRFPPPTLIEQLVLYDAVNPNKVSIQ